MLRSMPRTLSILAPSLVAALTLVTANSARADVAPPEPEPKVETPTPEPAKPEPEPAKTETKTETKTDAKSETKSDGKADSKTSSCSIQSSDNGTLLGFAALVLLISGAALRRREV